MKRYSYNIEIDTHIAESECCNLPSETVPEQSLSIREIMDRHMLEAPANEQMNGFSDDEDALGDSDYPEDFTDIPTDYELDALREDYRVSTKKDDDYAQQTKVLDDAGRTNNVASLVGLAILSSLA